MRKMDTILKTAEARGEIWYVQPLTGCGHGSRNRDKGGGMKFTGVHVSTYKIKEKVKPAK